VSSYAVREEELPKSKPDVTPIVNDSIGRRDDKITDKYTEEKFSASFKSSKVTFVPCGLRNIGNTCFMNSILQCVFATPHLTDYFMNSFQTDKKLRPTPLAQSYYELLQQVKQSNGSSSVTPSELKAAVSRTVSEFRGYGQQDAQEFMRFLLDRMHDELNRVKVKPPYKEMKFENLPVEKQSDGWFKYFRERDDSIMTDLFEGQLINALKCLSCGHETYAFDNFMDLSVEIPRKAVRFLGSIDIKDCLEKFVEAEKMIDCGYKCAGCKKTVNIEKNLTIYRFPKILVIHLKRFYNSAMRREKLNTTVSFPEKLDVRKYAPHSTHSSKESAVYRLFGISHHSGSLNGGHYIGEVYNFSNKNWYNCNDSIVQKISSPDTSSSSAYVLFYAMDP
jgi:ubiquitin carboxyl-terminal hydrolase 2